MADSIGTRLVAAVIRSKDFSVLPRHSIGVDDVFDDAKIAMTWVVDYVREHSDWPTTKMLEETKGIYLPEEEESADYVADMVRKRGLSLSLQKTIERGIEKIDSRDPDAAIELLSRETLLLKSRVAGSKPISFKSEGDTRLDKYRELKAAGGLLGIPTPWERMNSNIQGWVNGSLNVATAMMNTGKTWWLCHCADHALSLDKKVLLITLEMDTPRIEKRLDALHYKIPFGVLRNCTLDAEGEKKWADAVAAYKADSTVSGDILIADKKLVQTVSDVRLLCEDYKPDLVCIDGGYRFQGTASRNASNWESTVSVVNELQIAAELSRVPWIVTTQQGDANESGKPTKDPKKMHAWGVRYGKEWVINPDVVIGLYADDDLRAMKTLQMYTLKMRDSTGDGVFPQFTISWDLGKMDFREMIPMSEEAAEMAAPSLFESAEVEI